MKNSKLVPINSKSKSKSNNAMEICKMRNSKDFCTDVEFKGKGHNECVNLIKCILKHSYDDNECTTFLVKHCEEGSIMAHVALIDAAKESLLDGNFNKREFINAKIKETGKSDKYMDKLEKLESKLDALSIKVNALSKLVNSNSSQSKKPKNTQKLIGDRFANIPLDSKGKSLKVEELKKNQCSELVDSFNKTCEEISTYHKISLTAVKKILTANLKISEGWRQKCSNSSAKEIFEAILNESVFCSDAAQKTKIHPNYVDVTGNPIGFIVNI